jgi:hypothetical protein
MGCACQFPTPKHGNGDLAWSCQDEQSFYLWRGQLAGRWLLRLFQTLHLLPQLFSAQMPDQVIVGAINKGFIHLVLLGRLGQDEDFGVPGRRACLYAPATTSSCAPSTNSVPSGAIDLQAHPTDKDKALWPIRGYDDKGRPVSVPSATPSPPMASTLAASATNGSMDRLASTTPHWSSPGHAHLETCLPPGTQRR